MSKVIIESPFNGDVAKNLKYVRQCMRDCLLRNEAPFASHALYTQEGVLDDNIHSEREHGLEAGWAWTAVADKVVVYCDLGISSGMTRGIERAQQSNVPIEYRKLVPDNCANCGEALTYDLITFSNEGKIICCECGYQM